MTERRDADRTAPPSAAAYDRFDRALRGELGSARAAFDEAVQRADAAVSAGDRHALDAALAAQRALLADVTTRVERVVADAAVEREAEHVVASG